MKLIFYTACLVLGTLGSCSIMKYGQSFGLVDIPGDRSSHAKPTPKGGGIGILAAFILVAVWADVSFWFWGPVTAVALISLIGDKIELSPGFRLIVQFGAAGIVIWAGVVGGAITLLSFRADMILAVLAAVILLIFIVGTANIYNFMDGINGIAAITGIVGFSMLAFYAFTMRSETSAGIVCMGLACACLGFLPWNMPSAKVFMGDVGSILLGFVFAVMVIVLADKPADLIALAACLFPFYADELTTMAVRLKDGERLSKPHRRHLYQLLANEMGIAHWKISLGFGLCQLLVGYSAFALKIYGFLAVSGLLLFYFIGFILLSFYIRKRLKRGKRGHAAF